MNENTIEIINDIIEAEFNLHIDFISGSANISIATTLPYINADFELANVSDVDFNECISHAYTLAISNLEKLADKFPA